MTDDLNLVSPEKRTMYINYRNGSTGYWADIPKKFINQLPPRTSVILPDHGLLLFYKKKGGVVQFKKEESDKLIEIASDELPVTIKSFIKKSESKKKHEIKGALKYNITHRLKLAILLTSPQLLTSALLILFSNLEPYVILFIILCLAGCFLLTSAMLDNGKGVTSLICKSDKKSNSCGSLLDKNPFKYSFLKPTFLGLVYFFTIPVLYISGAYSGILIAFLSIFLVIILYAYRLHFDYHCGLCNIISIIILATASLTILQPQENVLTNSISQVATASGILLLLSVKTHIIIQTVEKFKIRSDKENKLKLFQSRIRTLENDLKIENSGLKIFLSTFEKSTLYSSASGNNKLHLFLTLNCPHCREMFLEVASNLESLKCSQLDVTLGGSGENYSCNTNKSSPKYSEEMLKMLTNFYLGNTRSIEITRAFELSNQPKLLYSPILLVNGDIFPNIYDIEDLYVYLNSKQS